MALVHLYWFGGPFYPASKGQQRTTGTPQRTTEDNKGQQRTTQLNYCQDRFSPKISGLQKWPFYWPICLWNKAFCGFPAKVLVRRPPFPQTTENNRTTREDNIGQHRTTKDDRRQQRTTEDNRTTVKTGSLTNPPTPACERMFREESLAPKVAILVDDLSVE